MLQLNQVGDRRLAVGQNCFRGRVDDRDKMNKSQKFERVVYGYWAKRFDCNRDDFLRPGTSVLIEEGLAETRKTYLYHIDKMSVIRAAPSLAKQAGLPDGYDRALGSLTVDILQGLAAGEYRFEIESTLLDCYLYPKDFEAFRVGGDFTTRRLDAEIDISHLMNLYAACSDEDLDYADIDLEHPDPVIFGIFADGNLVAYASHRYWDGVIADIGVLIHPDYRRQGLGKAVVSALSEWCIENDVVPMYRVFDNLAHSFRLSQSLGFKELVRIETLNVLNDRVAG